MTDCALAIFTMDMGESYDSLRGGEDQNLSFRIGGSAEGSRNCYIVTRGGQSEIAAAKNVALHFMEEEALPVPLHKDVACSAWNFGPVLVTIDDLKIALQRRGPDCLGSKKILAQLECRNSLQTTDKSCDPTFLTRKMVACRIAYAQETTTTNEVANSMKCTAQLEFIGTLLQLRGSTPVSQPLEDSSGNLLVYNGLCAQNDEHNNEMSNTDTGSAHEFCYWEELPCGIYSMELKSSNEHFTNDSYLLGVIRMHRWTDPQLTKIMSWDRVLLDPKIAHGISVQTGLVPTSTNIRYDMVHCEPAQRVLSALRRSVMRRTKMKIIQTAMKQSAEVETAPVAVLFSGGLDSMILSALLDQCLNPRYVIDLLNVSFDGQFAPDRVSARLGLKELQKFAPMRRWRLVEIDATLLNLTKETKHVMSLIHPADTYMDLNIGMAIWLAARGDGWVDEQVCSSFNRNQDHYKYKSEARVLFVGSGADEQCAGYGRHRTKYMHGGWLALHEEMRVDMQRIWKRNLGRDDRLISDHGKEARFPFLDEEVIQTLLEIPLWEIARLDEPAGKGDKKILREVAQLLGLEGAAALPKRAIQFGSRIAKESNRKNFGSNRAANQASAGSAKVGLHQCNQ